MDAFKRISVEQAKNLCADGAVMVDIRDPESFASGHAKEPFIWTTTPWLSLLLKQISMRPLLSCATTAIPAKALQPICTVRILAIYTAWMAVLKSGGMCCRS